MIEAVRSRKSSGLATWLAVALVALILACLAIEAGSYVFAVRRMQVRADSAATRIAETVVTRGTMGELTPRTDYSLQVERLSAGAADSDDQGAVRVEARSDWASPLFGLRRPIFTSATAGILPSARLGAPLRVVLLR